MRCTKAVLPVLLLAGAFASAHAQAPAPGGDSARPVPSMPGGRGMTGMDTQKMQELMTKMQAQMDKLRATSDPNERQKLMQEHMTTMREAMKGMHGMGGPMMGMMGGGPAGKAPQGTADERMRAMEGRMDMMQMMMEQMMQREEMMQRR